MSDLLDKMWSKLLAVIIIVLFVVGFREMIISDSSVAAAFDGLMETLPFAKVITDVICKVMGYQREIKAVTSASLIADFLKLAVIAFIQPWFVRFLSRIFLKVPNGTYYEQEKYMDGAGYRFKEMIITIITAPVISILASVIMTRISEYLAANFGGWLPSILGVASVVAFTALSIPALLAAGITLMTAILWRVCVTLLGKMAGTMITNAICLWMYLAIVGGYHSQTFGAIVSLVVWLIIMDLGMQCLQRAIVSKPVNKR